MFILALNQNFISIFDLKAWIDTLNNGFVMYITINI